ncbi:MAG: chemotaxis protein CheW [Deltaproteobacteria bacterium]|nr:MAG: chemotaxis protein CheW [Deltaproteobacteria bacterium]TMQ24339.1 MAG: chemotaxis protein CheW [Deltaproteobacteria bacterium]
MARDGQYCTFFVHGLFLGFEVTCIQEVIRYQPLTVVPLTSPVIAGLMNLRGQIVTAIDLRHRLGLPPRAPGERPLNVVVRTPDGAVSVLVDEIGDVIEVDSDAFERTPDTLTGDARELIRGVYKLEDRLLLVLDAVRTVDPETTN